LIISSGHWPLKDRPVVFIKDIQHFTLRSQLISANCKAFADLNIIHEVRIKIIRNSILTVGGSGVPFAVIIPHPVEVCTGIGDMEIQIGRILGNIWKLFPKYGTPLRTICRGGEGII
jgi:hypothetical protein